MYQYIVYYPILSSEYWTLAHVTGNLVYCLHAGVVKLADTLALGASARKSLEVRVLSPAYREFIDSHNYFHFTLSRLHNSEGLEGQKRNEVSVDPAKRERCPGHESSPRHLDTRSKQPLESSPVR